MKAIKRKGIILLEILEDDAFIFTIGNKLLIYSFLYNAA